MSTTRRANVNFADKQAKMHGQSVHRAVGDYDEASGILWNARPGRGVDMNRSDLPIGIFMATGNLIQFIPDGAETGPRETAQEVVDRIEGGSRFAEVEDGYPLEVARSVVGPARTPDPRAVPATEAAKKALEKRLAAQGTQGAPTK